MGTREKYLRIAVTLAIALVGAQLFDYLRLPLPYMLGSMTVIMLISMTTPMKLVAPTMLDPPGRMTIGLAIGAAFSPEIASRMLAFTPSLMILVAFLLVCTIVSYVAQRRWLGLDPATSFFAALPGGAASMILIGRSLGAEGSMVALLHGVRLFVLVAIIPNLVLWIEPSTGYVRPEHPLVVSDPGVWHDYVFLLAGGLAAGWIGRRLRWPSPSLLGAMLVSAVFYSTEIVHAHIPDMLVNAAQLLIGIELGNGFRREDRARVLRVGGFNVVVIAVLIGLAILVAMALHAIWELPYSLVLLAFTPGGLTEMSIMAFTMGLPVEFVAVHQVARVMLVPFAAPAAFRLLKPWLKRSG